jgi:hypothetical protein
VAWLSQEESVETTGLNKRKKQERGVDREDASFSFTTGCACDSHGRKRMQDMRSLTSGTKDYFQLKALYLDALFPYKKTEPITI